MEEEFCVLIKGKDEQRVHYSNNITLADLKEKIDYNKKFHTAFFRYGEMLDNDSWAYDYNFSSEEKLELKYLIQIIIKFENRPFIVLIVDEDFALKKIFDMVKLKTNENFNQVKKVNTGDILTDFDKTLKDYNISDEEFLYMF